jgi:signal transduction histidine kinase
MRSDSVHFVDDLLELSRIESHEVKAVLQPVELRSVVEQTVSLFDERAKKQSQTREMALPDQLPHVLADVRFLDQIL